MAFESNNVKPLNGHHVAPELNDLIRKIVCAAIEVHRLSGPDVGEHICEKALLRELAIAGLHARTRVPFRAIDKGVDTGVRVVGLLVEDRVIVECKCVTHVTDVDHAQLVERLRFAGLPVGLIINFKVLRLVDGLVRRVNTSPSPPHPDSLVVVRPPAERFASAANSALS